MATIKDNLADLKSSEDLHRKGNQIFVRNLSYETTSDDLISLFQEYGPVKRAAIVQEDGISRGFGFVKFALGEDASAAIKILQGREFKGRKIALEIAVNRGENPVKFSNSKATQKTSMADVSINQNNITSESSIATPKTTTALLSKPKSIKREISSSRKLENSSVEKKNSSDIQLNHSLSAQATTEIAKSQSAPLPTQAKNATATTQEEKQSPSGLVSSNRRGLQIVLFGIPSDINKKVVKRVASKCSRKYEVTVELVNEEHPMFPLLSVTNPQGKVMLIKAKSRKQTALLLTKFNNATVHNLGLRQMKAENTSSKTNIDGDDIEKVVAVVDDKGRKEHITAKVLSTICCPLTLRKRKCRVIIRNLSFQADETNIAARLGSFGPVQDVWLPRVAVPVSERSRRRKGTGAEAEAEAETDVKMRPRGFAFVTFLCPEDALAAVKGCQGLKICNREVAIDFCESKDIFQEHQLTDSKDEGKEKEVEGKETMEEEEDEDDEDSDEDEDSDGEEESSDENDDDDDEEEGDKKSGKRGADRHKSENQKKEPKVAPDDVSEGKTVFVRDLSFDATVADLRKSFGVFGKIEMAALVKDKDTGLNRGSAFVKFASLDSVGEALNSEFPILVQDRPCRVTVALDKTSAVKMKEDVKTASSSKDRRNLYLSVEGLKISENMSEPDRQKRKRAQLEKKKKLCNPLYFISPTRISVRGLKKSLTDEQLRSLCMKAAKAGLARHLVTPSDVDRLLLAQFAPLSDRTPGKLVVPPITGGTIKSAKIMLDLKRLRDGKPQSRGYGFVEFTCHAHALSCLRELDSNPVYASEAAPGGQSLLVEFSLENVEKVKLLQSREQRRQQTQKAQTPTPTPAQLPKKHPSSTSASESNSSNSSRSGSGVEPPSPSTATGASASTNNQKSSKKRKSETLSSSEATATVSEDNNNKKKKQQRSNDRNSNNRNENNRTSQTKSTGNNTDFSTKKNKKSNNKDYKNNNSTKTTAEASSVKSPSVTETSKETSKTPTPQSQAKQSLKRKSVDISSSSSDNNNNNNNKSSNSDSNTSQKASSSTTAAAAANKKRKKDNKTVKPTTTTAAAAGANNNNNNKEGNSNQPRSGKKSFQKKKGGGENTSEGVVSGKKKQTTFTSQGQQENATGSYRGFKRIRDQKKMRKS